LSKSHWLLSGTDVANTANESSEGTYVHMTYQSMMAFAESWIAAWNRRDVDAVLAHYSEEAQFVSPVARNLVDEEPGSKYDRASAQLSHCYPVKSPPRHLRSPLRALFRRHQSITSSQHCLSRNRAAETRSDPVSALAQEAAELARATCRRFQAASFDSTKKRRRAIRRYNKDRR